MTPDAPLRRIDAPAVEAVPAHKVDGGQLEFLSGTLSTLFIVEMLRLCLDLFYLTLHNRDMVQVVFDSLLTFLDV